MRRFRIWVIRIGSTLLGAIAVLSLLGAKRELHWHTGVGEAMRFNGWALSRVTVCGGCGSDSEVINVLELGLLVAVPTAIVLAVVPTHRPGTCPHCDYDLYGNVSGVCPECGLSLEYKNGTA